MFREEIASMFNAIGMDRFCPLVKSQILEISFEYIKSPVVVQEHRQLVSKQCIENLKVVGKIISYNFVDRTLPMVHIGDSKLAVSHTVYQIKLNGQKPFTVPPAVSYVCFTLECSCGRTLSRAYGFFTYDDKDYSRGITPVANALVPHASQSDLRRCDVYKLIWHLTEDAPHDIACGQALLRGL